MTLLNPSPRKWASVGEEHIGVRKATDVKGDKKTIQVAMLRTWNPGHGTFLYMVQKTKQVIKRSGWGSPGLQMTGRKSKLPNDINKQVSLRLKEERESLCQDFSAFAQLTFWAEESYGF